MEPEKPFACSLPDCGMTFTNEDHLHVHTKKHDMVLQLGMEQKAAFVADQTPTPTRFIRNCEEVGLFQDLQNVNPFDEGFKRAMETKHGTLSLEAGSSSEDVLHTPHLVFPLEPGDCALYTANNQRNITISRSSSDESGAVKEYETTTISKLTNEITTISRIVGNALDRGKSDDVSILKHEELARNKEETSVSYTNNVIIHSNVEIRKDLVPDKTPAKSTDSDKRETLPPIMSQRSLDFVVDSLTSDVTTCDASKAKRDVMKSDKDKALEDYEVIIKLPDGKHVKMKAVEENERTIQNNTKEKLKKVIRNKSINNTQGTPRPVPVAIVQSVPITAGTLIPVTVLNSPLSMINNPLQKIPIVSLPTNKSNPKTVKRKFNRNDVDRTEIKEREKSDNQMKKTSKEHLESRSAASKRYRDRLRITMLRQGEENKHLREVNHKLNAEKAVLQLIITEHLKKCPVADDLRNIQAKLKNENERLKNTDL